MFKKSDCNCKKNKNLTKEQNRIRLLKNAKRAGKCKKATEAANKEEIAKLIADAEDYLSKHYNKDYYDIVANKAVKLKKKKKTADFEKLKNRFKEEHQKNHQSLKDAEEIKAEKYTHKNKLYDAQMTHESRNPGDQG